MALIECGECGKSISDKAASCPNCGAPPEKRPAEQTPITLENIDISSSLKGQIESHGTTGKPEAGGNPVAIVLICLIGCLVLFLFFWKPKIGKSANVESNGLEEVAAPRDNSSMAFIQCKSFVKSKLKAPSTADFPFLEGDTVRKGDGVYIIRSHVDSQNSYGAKLRNKYVCATRWNGNDEKASANWELLHLEITE